MTPRAPYTNTPLFVAARVLDQRMEALGPTRLKDELQLDPTELRALFEQRTKQVLGTVPISPAWYNVFEDALMIGWKAAHYCVSSQPSQEYLDNLEGSSGRSRRT